MAESFFDRLRSHGLTATNPVSTSGTGNPGTPRPSDKERAAELKARQKREKSPFISDAGQPFSKPYNPSVGGNSKPNAASGRYAQAIQDNNYLKFAASMDAAKAATPAQPQRLPMVAVGMSQADKDLLAASDKGWALTDEEQARASKLREQGWAPPEKTGPAPEVSQLGDPLAGGTWYRQNQDLVAALDKGWALTDEEKSQATKIKDAGDLGAGRTDSEGQRKYNAGLIFSRSGDQLKDEAPDVAEMDEKTYRALSPEERAVVDYNTALVDAVEADRELTRPAEKTDAWKQYDQALKGAFRDVELSGDAYSPNTLALIKSLGMQDNMGSIEDFTSLRTAGRQSDMDTLGLTTVSELSTRGDLLDRIIQKTKETDTLLDRKKGWAFDGAAGRMEPGLYSGIDNFSEQLSAYFQNTATSFGAPEPRSAADAEEAGRLLGITKEAEFIQNLSPAERDNFPTILSYIGSAANKNDWDYETLVKNLKEQGLDPQRFFEFSGASLNAYESGLSPSVVANTDPSGYLSSAEILKSLGMSTKWLKKIKRPKNILGMAEPEAPATKPDYGPGPTTAPAPELELTTGLKPPLK